MPVVSDIKLKKDVNVRVRQMLKEITDILNEGGYEEKIYTTAPSSTDPGFEGETRLVKTGATVRVYKYISSSWWYSGTYTQVS